MDKIRIQANKEELLLLLSIINIEILVQCFGLSVYQRYYEIMNGLQSFENEKTLKAWDEYLLENNYYTF